MVLELPVSNDFLLAVGTVTGIVTKMYALRAESTVWSRKSSGVNILLYPFTALYPFFSLGLVYTFTGSLITFLIWCGIYVFRAPSDEDWIGRVDMTYTEYFKKVLSGYVDWVCDFYIQ